MRWSSADVEERQTTDDRRHSGQRFDRTERIAEGAGHLAEIGGRERRLTDLAPCAANSDLYRLRFLGCDGRCRRRGRRRCRCVCGGRSRGGLLLVELHARADPCGDRRTATTRWNEPPRKHGTKCLLGEGLGAFLYERSHHGSVDIDHQLEHYESVTLRIGGIGHVSAALRDRRTQRGRTLGTGRGAPAYQHHEDDSHRAQ